MMSRTSRNKHQTPNLTLRQRARMLTKGQRGLLVASVLAVVGLMFLLQSMAAVNPNLKGDLNNDNKVNISDLSILLTNFNKTTSAADLNADGKVNISDLSLLLSNFGKTYTPGTTPPTTPPVTPPTTPPTTPPAANPYIAPGISKGLINDAGNSTAADANDMKTLGIKWARGWLNCGEAQDEYDSIKRMKDNGVTYLPSYNCGINESMDSYKAKLKADMAVLMPLGIHVWEIGNEMNGGWNEQDNYCNNNSTPGNMQCAEREYTKFLKAAYETVHANDPQGVVVYGGITNWEVNFPPWMESMLSNPDQPWKYMDGFGFHPYGSTVQSSMASMDKLADYMSRNAEFATKPIWITEYGCWSYELNADQQSPCEPHNETGKAQYLVGMLNALKVWKKGTSFEIRTPVCWYIIHEPGDAIGYGLKKGSGAGGYVEAFTAYKNYSF